MTLLHTASLGFCEHAQLQPYHTPAPALSGCLHTANSSLLADPARVFSVASPVTYTGIPAPRPCLRQWYCLRLGPPGRWPGPSVCGCLCPAYPKLVVVCSFEPLEAPLLSWLISPLAMGLPTAEPFLFFRSLLGIQVLSYFLFSPFALLATWGSFLFFQVFEVFSCSVGVL